MTLKLTGVSPRSQLVPPPGGLLHRSGDRVWITTPPLGRRGGPPTKPAVELAYQGPVRDVSLDPPRAVAGVRLMQSGDASPLRIELLKPDGSAEPLVSGERARVKPQWGSWLLLPTVPDRPAVVAREVRVATDPALKRMEIWAVADGALGNESK